MSSVLYDAPGPRARRNALIGSIVGGLALLGLAAVRVPDAHARVGQPAGNGLQDAVAAGAPVPMPNPPNSAAAPAPVVSTDQVPSVMPSAPIVVEIVLSPDRSIPRSPMACAVAPALTVVDVTQVSVVGW